MRFGRLMCFWQSLRPHFLCRYCDRKFARRPPKPIASVVMWYFKKNKNMQKTILFLLTILFLQSCNVGTSGTWKNENIDKKKREQIKLLNDKLYNSIFTQNISEIKSLLSDDLLEQEGNNIDKILAQVHNSISAKKYKILYEYYIQNSKTNILNSLPSGNLNKYAYSVQYQAINREMYVSLLLPEGQDNEFLMSVIS